MPSDAHKVAIVTGASRGIGAAIAERLGQDGLAVVVNYAGSAGAAQQVAQKIESSGGKAQTVQCDVSKADEVKRMFDAAEASFGGVDVLVNNAGVMRLAPLTEASDELVDSQIAINLKGVINTVREAARRIRDGGRIINLSSSVVGLALPSYGPYIATKAAVEGVTRVLANELRGRNITVNAVAPGPTATDLFLDGKSPELVDRMAKMNPLERLGSPDDIANVVAFLAGPDGGWVNGQVLRANGGMI
jgi:3-oxoacyl-[acyl-carrier protein] reductase